MDIIQESILTLFFAIVRKQPTCIAVQDGGSKLSYKDLEVASCAVAARLTQEGISRGDVVPVVTQSSLHMVIGVLGVLRAGATYVPLDRSQWPLTKIKNTISRLGSRIAIYTGPDIELGPDVARLSVEAAMRRSRKVAKLRMPNTNTRSSDIACIIFTSGTTGEPKGVILRHSSLLHFVTSPPFNYNITPQDRVLLVLSCAFDACMGILFSVVCNGGCVVIADGSNFQERVRQCTVFVGTPSILEALDPPKSPCDYSLLDRLILGGETPTDELLKRWMIINKPIWIAYGPTEATCATLMGKITVSATSKPSDPRILDVPIAGSTITIVDGSFKPITALGQEGELLISGPGLAKGYWRDVRQTEEKFILFEGKRTYRTGDYVKWVKGFRGHHNIYFCGRKDRTVKLRGFLVNLDTDVDAAILKHIPEVKGAYSFSSGTHLYAAVRPGHLDEVSLLSQFHRFLPQYMLPERVVMMDSFPTNSYGKKNIRKLQSLALQKLQSDATKHFEEPKSSHLGIELLNGLHEVLGTSKNHVNCALSFIGHGIYSLTAVRLSFYLQRRGYTFRPQDFLSSVTIDAFIQANYALKPNVVVEEPQKPLRPDAAPSMSPLTPQQLRLVHGTLKHPKFNIVNYILECDCQHLNRLRGAFGLLERTEPIFRTSIEVDDGQYIQRLQSKPCSVWSEGEIDSRNLEEQVIITAANTGLGNRFTVFKLLGTTNIAVVWSVHHALMDGFSAALILGKLEQALHGDVITPSVPFPAAVHSLQASTERQQAVSRQFWEDQERLIPQASGDLPIPEPQSSNLSLTHREHSVVFDRSTADRVARYCMLQNITPAAIHYAAWSLALATYTGSANVVFGAVLSGRDRNECCAESLIGCLLDTLPFRNHIDRATTSSEFVRGTHQLIRSVSRFHGSSDQARQVSFSTALSCDPDLPERGLAHLGFPSSSRITQYPDLPLLVVVRQDGHVLLVYMTEKYCEEDITVLGDLYKNIFVALLVPQLTVWDVLQRKFPSESQDCVLALGNFHGEESYMSSAAPATTIATMFDDATADYSAMVAIEKGSTRMTYAQMKQNVENLAGVLQSHVQPGDTVCVLADRSMNWIIGLFAILKISAVYCPVDADHLQSHQERIIELSEASLVLYDRVEQLQSLPKNRAPSLCMSDILKSIPPNPCSEVQRRTSTNANDAAFLVFTSGSTGESKGILIENRSLVALQGSYRTLFKSPFGGRIAQFLSPGFDVALQEIIWSLCSGATLVLRKDAENPFSHISSVDTIMVTPSVAANLDPDEYPNLRYIHLAGEPVPERVVKLWDTPGREIYNIYGPAESTIVTCAQRLKSDERVCIGRPLPSVRVYILNDHLELLPPGVIGNIYVAGIQVSRGYINNESKTKSSFLVDPFAFCRPCQGQERMYSTGDLGYMARDGRLYYRGRKDRQIKLRGYRTNLDDVADTARKLMSAVRKAFVAERDGRLVLWTEPGDVNRAKLRELLSTTLPAHALPSHIIALEQFPLNPNGKIDSKKLADMDLPTYGSDGATTPETCELSRDESLIAEEWRSLLSLQKTASICADDSFIAMGGHSVLQLALAARLKQKFKLPVTVRDVIYAPTLGKLASIIDKQRQVEQHQHLDERSETRKGEALGPHRLSPPELDWWYRYRSAEQLSAFNVPFVAFLTPGVDLNRLKAAIEASLARHHVLRSRFISSADDSEPQRILSPDAIMVHMAGEEFDVENLINRPFDPRHEPLVRVVLTHSLVAFSISHMAMDLTALSHLLSDVAMVYNADSDAPISSPRQYFEVQQWNTVVDVSNLSFWRSYLGGTARSRQVSRPKRSYRGTFLLADVADETYQHILARAAEQHISLHHFALSATGLVLQALVGRVPVVIGSPYVNRTLEMDHSVIGLFLEPLPIRIDWTQVQAAQESRESESSAALLQATKASSQSALAHAMPWPTLMQTLDLPFPSLQQELFDVVVTLHDHRHDGGPQLAIPGVAATMPNLWPQGAKFPLCFELYARADRLTVRLEYDTDIMHGGHARILHDMLLAATDGLLDSKATYADIIQQTEGVLCRACAEQGVPIDELPRIAQERLV